MIEILLIYCWIGCLLIVWNGERTFRTPLWNEAIFYLFLWPIALFKKIID